MLKKANKNKRNILLFCVAAVFLAVGVFVFLTHNSAAVITNVAQHYSQHTDYSNQEQGAWRITQTATASSTTEAELKIKAESILKGDGKDKDVYVMLDTSGSMTNERITKTTTAIKTLANTLFASGNGNNRVAMAAFNSDVVAITNGFVNDSMVFNLSITDNLPVANGGTDYYKALQKIDDVFSTYEYDENRNPIVLFITDGAPVEDHPLEEAEFQLLKSKYPWLTVQGIQFEMGDEVIEPIKKVSDNQFVSFIDDVEDVVFEAAMDGYKYTEFTIDSDINSQYYEIASVETTVGTASVSGNRVTWDASNAYRSGTKRTLTIKLNVKQVCIDKEDGICATTTRTQIKTQLPDTPSESIDTGDAAILQFRYDIIYDLNAPTGCDASANTLPATDKHLVYTTAEISSYVPVCTGFEFRGWALISDKAHRQNNNYFTMPEEDVILRAIWAAPSISKSMDGTLRPTTYATFKKASPSTYSTAASRNGYETLYTTIAGSRANIEHIEFSQDTPPIDAILDDTTNFASADSELPIFGYYIPDTKTFYFYSDADVVYLNEDSRGLFAEMGNLKTVGDMSALNASRVKYFDYLFYRSDDIVSLEGLADWKTPELTSLTAAFYSAKSIANFHGLENWDVRNVTNMNGLAQSATGLTSVEALANWQTDSLTNLSSAFRETALANLNGLDDWDVSNVTSMSAIFRNANALTDISALAGWQTGNVATFDYAFAGSGTPVLTNLTGLEDWDVTSATDMSYMFYGRKKLESLEALRDWRPRSATTFQETFNATAITSTEPLSEWTTDSLTNLDSVFMDCTKLTDLSGLASWDVDQVTTMRRIFARDSALSSLTALSQWKTHSLTTLSQAFWSTGVTSAAGLGNWDATKLTSVYAMFQRAGKLTEVSDLASWQTDSLTTVGAMFDYDYYSGGMALTSLHGLEDWNVSKVTAMNDFCFGCRKITSLEPLKKWRPALVTTMYRAFDEMELLTSLDGIENWQTPSLTNLESTFANMTALTDISQISGWDVSKVTTMAGTFDHDSNLTNITPISSWTTTALKSLNGTFRNTAINSLNALAGWTTNNVETIASAFSYTSITNVDALSGWNVGKLTTMFNAFSYITTLTDVTGFSGWNQGTTSLTAMNSVFVGDTALTSLSGLEGWNVAKVTAMNSAFNKCTSLQDISALENWSTGKVKNTYDMFVDDTSLTSVYALRNWNVESVTNASNMFSGVNHVEDFRDLDNWQFPSNVSMSGIFNRTSSTAILPQWMNP